jgi:HAD superfamily hydrolase (TIGR01549 family)
MYKFISFDLWGTLIKHNPSFSLQRNELIRLTFPEINISDNDIKIAKNYSDYSNESLGEQLSWRQAILNILMKNNMYKFIPKEQISIRFNKLEIEQKNLFLNNHPTLFSDETLSVLNELKNKNLKMGICSNTSFINGYILHTLLDKLNISNYFKVFIFSDWVNISKPNPLIFREVINRSQYKPTQILHVGDNVFADGGSENVGIDFIHINGNSNKTISEILKFI